MLDGGARELALGGWTSVPVGVSYFPAEIMHFPRLYAFTVRLVSRMCADYGFTRWSNMLGKLVFESEHEAGGHFAAFEVPEKLAGDLRKMYGKGGPAYGIVPGKTGFDA